MSIRLIASDMDGTLLDPYLNISDANIQAIKKAQEAGVEFIISSGRDYRGAKAKLDEYGITCGYICLSGATVYDESGRPLLDIPMSREDLLLIRDIVSPYGADMDILTSHGQCTTMVPEKKLSYYHCFLNGWKPCSEPVPDDVKAKAEAYFQNVRFITSVEEIPTEAQVYKVCLNNLPEETVKSIKKEFGQYPSLAAASSFPTNVELTHVRAQKGPALKAYAAIKGIALEDVMVLGDSDNDLSMFQEDFGWTVAMGNSMDCIRDAARYHTCSNTEDGVARAIERFVLLLS